MNDLQLGFELMTYGLLGVFSVLLIFIGMINALKLVFPPKDDGQ